MIKQSLFIDTSGWANYFIKTEPFHIETTTIIQRCFNDKVELVTSNYVIAELCALLYSPLRVTKTQQITILDAIRTASWIKIVHINPVIEQRAYQLWKSRTDKNWSLADCSSFIVMQDYGLSLALTSDHHFEQAGFIQVLKK